MTRPGRSGAGPADRRAVLRLAIASALAGAGATRAFAAAVPGEPFVPPGRPLRFSRLLERTMARGHRFVVERDFIVSFARAAAGFVLSGEQTAVAVEAPERLAELAGLERARVERGLFPLRLDAAGRIDDEARGMPFEGIEEVLAATRAVLAQRPLDAATQAEAAQFMALVHSSAASFLSRLPVDLFAPSAARRVEERALDLPGALGGTVRVEFVAAADPATGVMRRARREITTSIEGDSRVTRETWTLDPL